MGEISIIGLDIAKQVFHAHGVDASAMRLEVLEDRLGCPPDNHPTSSLARHRFTSLFR